MHTHPWSWTTDQCCNADSRGKQIIIYTKSACARETMWNLFMRNITKCSTGKPRTPQLKSTDTIWKFQVRVCLFCYAGGCMQYRGVAFVSVSLSLYHSNTPPHYHHTSCPLSISFKLMYINNTRQITREAERKLMQQFLH